MNRPPVFAAAVLLALLGTLSAGEEVQVTLDAAEQKTFELQCTQDQGVEVTWTFKDKAVEPKEKDKEYMVFPENATLRVLKVDAKLIGVYTCSDGNALNKEFHVRVKPFVTPFEKPRNVIQDDPMRLECRAWGVPDPSLVWLYNGNVIEPEEHVLLLNSSTMENVTLFYKKMSETAGGNYTCVATSVIDDVMYSANATVVVTVKDKYAALWPFLGICAEVAVLCTIILIYEKRRAKRIEQEEQRAEEAAHLNPNSDTKAPLNDDPVRQRK